jgi:hypothetical protein
MRNLIDDSSMKEVLGDLAAQLSSLVVAAMGLGKGKK